MAHMCGPRRTDRGALKRHCAAFAVHLGRPNVTESVRSHLQVSSSEVGSFHHPPRRGVVWELHGRLFPPTNQKYPPVNGRDLSLQLSERIRPFSSDMPLDGSATE